MLQFNKIEINNFGPYKGRNEVCLDSKDGVTIFWGENGRGKTTLLNAFRYGLFGVVQGRHNRNIELRTMENSEGKAEGQYGFSVAIEMKYDDAQYRLVRSYTPISTEKAPLDDSDYEKNVYMYKNGSILSKEELNHTLNSLMPVEVSRFFLFDGELLKDYEDLVNEEESSSDLIKESIEKILGVPILQNAIRDLNSYKNQIDNNMNRAAQNSRRTTDLSTRMSGVKEAIQRHKAALESFGQKFNDLKEEKRGLEEQLEKDSTIRGLINTEKVFNEDIDKLRKAQNDILFEISGVTSSCWRGMISNRLDSIVGNLNSVIEGFEQKRVRGITANNFIQEMKKACKDAKCPICTQELGPNLLAYLEEKIKDDESEFSGLTSNEEEMLIESQSRKSCLQGLSCPSQKDVLVSLEKRLNQIAVDIDSKVEDLKRTKSKIDKYKEANGDIPDFEQTLRNYTETNKQINNIQDAITSEKNDIKEKEIELQTIFSQLKKCSDGNDELAKAIEKSQKFEKISKVFEVGIEKYCKQLKENVERDATEIFLKLASDKGYAKLVINDRYGLEIYTSNDTIVPNRSSGYEHVVALSLIAALHKNAPLQGPIIMDSPFGRLDKTHSKNIIEVLPLMANQVILLAFDSEIEAQQARAILGNALISERKLNYISSFHTSIQ